MQMATAKIHLDVTGFHQRMIHNKFLMNLQSLRIQKPTVAISFGSPIDLLDDPIEAVY